MGKIILSDDDLDNDERAPATLMSLPDELTEWARQNQELVLRIQNALSDTYTTLTEDQLWETIAAAASPEWQKARMELNTAEARWADLNSPANAPLGAIGNALDSVETNSAQEALAISLSDFTIINEGLRQREDLGRLLNVLLVQKRMLDHSAEHTYQALKSTAALADLVSIRDDFRKAAKKATRIQKQFKLVAQKLFARKKEKIPMSGPVPWSTEI